MTTIIKNIVIKDLFKRKKIDWDLQDVNVLVGKNGSGKSTIIQIIAALLRQELNESLSNSSFSQLTLANEGTVAYKVHFHGFDADNLLVFLNAIKKSDLKGRGKDKEKKQLNELIQLLKSKNESQKIKELGMGSFKVSENIKNTKRINVELISTINMSANSIYEFKKSDGERTTILDMEIASELERLKHAFKISEDAGVPIQEKLEAAINSLFAECNKFVHFNNGKIFIKMNDSGKEIRYDFLSSGERQLLYILIKTANASLEKTVLLMDEPEISLHLTWQEKLINTIKSINDNCQLIIVTHSPAILMKGWMDSFVDIKNISKESSND
ncbi:ABC transporter family protein [Proteus mirabilis]|uniref:AAA family ATPase n=1 Tax=Proteus mirabilis TaxID=584 RepID=UPI000506B355|nr:ATP-binding protein [Proteus mirabilis]KGA89330.1 ABC transporter family protein [Proteus mirabilis]